MRTYTQKQLRELVEVGAAVDVSNGDNDTRRDIISREDYLTQIGYAAGAYGCSGLLLQGHNTGTLYAVTRRTIAVFIFS